MTTLLVIIWTLAAISLILVLAMRPARTHRSWFELKRRGDDAAMRREKLLGDVLALRRAVSGLLLVVLVFAGFGAWQGLGAGLSVALWLVSGAICRWKPVRSAAMKLYARSESSLLDAFERAPLLGSLLRAETYVPRDQKLESLDQLRQLVESSGHVLSADQQTIVRHGLDWHATAVAAVMTPVGEIASIKRTELLGPLVLDDLHRSGHDRFPVTGKGGIDDIVGILDVTQLLDITGGKRSETVEKVMSYQVLRIESDAPLPAALDMLERSHLHMLVAVDPAGKTAGIVTLADITGSLLGKNRGEVVK